MSAAHMTGYGAAGRSNYYTGGMNSYVLVVACQAAIGGVLFGFDVGIVGGVETMYYFQRKFFPDIAARQAAGIKETDPFCVYNDHRLQLFSASMFLAGAVMAIPAGHITRGLGRKVTMIMASCLFLIGAGLQSAAVNLTMLVLGRVTLGLGVGSASEVVPLYIGEAAPYSSRGALTTLFQLAITCGILVAQLVNFGNQVLSWGWRLSLGLAALPAMLLLAGSLLLPESPNSLIERGKLREGRKVLERLRGTPDVDAEYADICEAAAQAGRVTLWQSWTNLLRRKYLPMTVVICCMGMLQQLTGINAIMLYSALLFNSLGSNRSSALAKTMVVGAVNVLATFVSVVTVDRMGRRPLLMQGGIQMLLALIVLTVTLGVGLEGHILPDVSPTVEVLLLIFVCVFVAGFAWSWGPLAWLLGAEIHVLEMRAAGASLNVFCNFLMSFIIGQSFLAMLCGMREYVFLFFAAWVCIMTLFVIFLLPETKGAPIEEHLSLFAKHPFWRRVMGPAADEVLQQEEFRKAAFEQAQRDHGDVRLVAAYYKAMGIGDAMHGD